MSVYRSFQQPAPDLADLPAGDRRVSFGSVFVKRLLSKSPPCRLVIVSRDKQKQEHMARQLPAAMPQLFDRSRVFIGDVYEVSRLELQSVTSTLSCMPRR